MKADKDPVIAKNPRAGRDFHLLETVEAGLVLEGAEVKSVRAHRVHLADSFAWVDRGRMVLYNLEISPYPQAGLAAPEPKRPRQLLLHRAQIARLGGEVARSGRTLIPTKIYFKGPFAKVELALAQGKTAYDKRDTIRERETAREMQRAVRRRLKP